MKKPKPKPRAKRKSQVLPTPLTDAAQLEVSEIGRAFYYNSARLAVFKLGKFVVCADFARKLERENTQLRAKLATWETVIGGL